MSLTTSHVKIRPRYDLAINVKENHITKNILKNSKNNEIISSCCQYERSKRTYLHTKQQNNTQYQWGYTEEILKIIENK